ncbi:LLM class flavin-dependent oxidoreductase [Streptomyces sp. NPDC029526]|uniref:LLM class flavin-dependent oxidoreductase n=1 Tax=Streptomyces sp. NPDC029526 TaxID=3155728 RepID=UPI0033C7EE34
MKFGINLFPTIGPADKSAVDHFDDALRLAVLAEELGFHHVKTVEHYFFDYGGYSPDPVTFLAAAAARTRRIRLVTGAVIPAFTHPVKLAGQLAMLDNLSHGRLDVGFARGFLPDEFAAFGIPMDESRERFEEGVEACERLWAGEDVVFSGRFHRFGPVTLLPRPAQRPYPKVLVAASITPESCAAAGRAGRGLMLVPSINKPERTREMIDLYRRSRAEAGHDPDAGEVHLSYSSYLHEDAGTARERGRRYSAYTNAKMVEAVSAWAHTRSGDYDGYQRIVAKVNSANFDKQVDEGKALVGSPEQVRAQLRQVREWYGDCTVSLQVISGNMPYEESARTMRLFAGEVMPGFTVPEPGTAQAADAGAAPASPASASGTVLTG